MLLLFFALSLFTLLIGVIVSLKRKSGRHQMLSPYQWMMVFLFVAALWFFVPYYLSFFRADPFGEKLINTVFLSAHHAICLFVVGADYGELYSYAITQGPLGIAYSLYGSVLYLASPLMTFGFILSFFQDLTVRMRIRFGRKNVVYLFSELNEQSIHLSSDIREKDPGALIMFSNLHSQEDEYAASLEKSAHALDAILFHRDIVSIADSLPQRTAKVNCMILGEREEINIQQTALLLKMEHIYPLDIYVLSQQENHLFENIPLPEKTSLFRINHVRTSVLQTLEQNADQLFRNAAVDKCGDRKIGVMVLGMGAYGSEMVKALSWFTQAEGYTTEIHCFDQDPMAMDRFKHACPGYFHADFNTRYCSIRLYAGLTCGTQAFDSAASNLKDISYVFIALGDDDLNICTAYEMRTLFARCGSHPVIQAIVRNSDKKQLMEGRKTYRGQDYEISYVGSLRDQYTFDSIFSLERKEEIVEENAKWSSREIAVRELNNSTIYEWSESFVLHRRVTAELDMYQYQRDKSDHRRWVNLMFSYGYLPPAEHQMRDDIAKVHPYLCDYELCMEKMRTKS